MSALEELARTAQRLCRPGTGLLAADESTSTIGKRFEKAGINNVEVSCVHSPEAPCLCALLHYTHCMHPALVHTRVYVCTETALHA